MGNIERIKQKNEDNQQLKAAKYLHEVNPDKYRWVDEEGNRELRYYFINKDLGIPFLGYQVLYSFPLRGK